MDNEILHELEDYAEKSSGDRKTHVASCLVFLNHQKIFGANRLKDSHGLTEEEIEERAQPKFYDAMKCAEADALDKAAELGLDLAGATLYSLLFPCPRCAEKISKTNLKQIVAYKHRTKRNGTFDNPLTTSKATFDKVGVKYSIGKPDSQ